MVDWRDIVRADVASLPSSGGEPGERSATTTFRLPVFRMLLEASRQRRLSPAAYVRRATMAMICHDLGVPLSEAVKHDPRMSRENGYPVLDESGTGFGPWEIDSLMPLPESADD